MEFPMYFSLFAEPGYNSDRLRKYGFYGSDWFLFSGNPMNDNNTTHMTWSHGNVSIKGFYEILNKGVKIQNKYGNW